MRKIVSLIIVLTLAVIPCSFEAAENTKRDEACIDFITELDISSKTLEEADLDVTRGEFADMLIRAMNLQPNGTKKVFSDVSESDTYFGAIAKAAEMEIIAGSGNGLFIPDGKLSFAAALKMTVSALGYTSQAAAYGGYPTGYLYVANEIDLLRGVNKNSNEMTFSNCAVLLYNFLNCDLCEVIAVENGNITSSRSAGKTILSERYGLKRVEGVIETAGHFSADPEYVSGEKKIGIGGKLFDTAIADAEKFFGFAAICWYDDDNNNIKAVYRKPANNVIVINSEDIGSFADNALSVFNHENGSETVYKLDKAYTFVKNGRAKTPEAEDFYFKNSSVEIIDNNGDGKFDIISVFAARYMVVSSVDKKSESIFDSNTKPAGMINCKSKDETYCEISLYKKGQKMSSGIDNITSGSVITCFESEKGDVKILSVCSDVVNGTITEAYKDKIFIDGKEYKTNSYFQNNINITVGFSGVFLLASDGTVTFITDYQKSDLNYGYFTDFAVKNGISSEASIAIMTRQGTFIYPKLSDYVTVDGERVKSTGNEIKDKLLNGSLPRYQLIRYGINKEGRIDVIDTAEEIDSSLDISEKYNKSFAEDDSLTRYLNGVKAYYHASYNQFNPFALLDSAVIFKVPSDIQKGNITSRFDEDNFEIGGEGSLSNGTYLIDAYDMTKGMKPAAVVVYDDAIGAGMKLDRSVPISVVSRVADTLTDDGVVLKTLTVWNNGTYIKCPVSSDTYNLLVKNGSVPKPGDVIRFVRDGNGIITKLCIDGVYNQSTCKVDMTSSAVANNQLDWTEYTGYVYNHDSSSVTLKVDKVSGFSSSYSDSLDKTDNLCALIIRNTQVAVFDTKDGIVRQGELDMLKDGFAVGENDASYVFIKSYANGVNQLIIYR